MNRIIRFGFATYESLVQKLGATDSPAAIYQLYQSHKDLFKHEHVVLSLRMLGRHCKQMTQDDDLNELTGKLNDIVGQLSEYDVVDVLFWLRKWRSAKLPTNVSQATQQTLFTKIQQMAESHMFTFRNMVNVYYDLAMLNQNNDFLAKILQEQILISKQISPFILIQLMSAQVTKINNCNISKFDTQILQNAMKVIDNMLDDFDLEQKSLLFKTLSEVQFQNISPRFSLPQQIKRLKDSLLEKVELLQEESVLNIFRAYQYLPKYFENDLLRELKDMIITTIEQNPANLTSKFLVHLIERISSMAYIRVPFDLTRKIVQEIAKRITNKEVEQFLIIQLCSNIDRNQKHEELIKALQTLDHLPPKILDYLFHNNVNLQSHVVSLIQSQKKINLFNAAHYVVYAQRDSKEHVEQLAQICKDSLQSNPQLVLRTLKDTELMSGIRFQLQEEAFMAVVQLVKSKQLDFGRTVRDLLNGVVNSRCRSAFIQLYEEQTIQNPKLLFNRLVQEFDTFNSETLNVVLQVLQKDPASIPLNRLVDFLTLNQHKLMGLIKSDQIQWATSVVILPFLANTDMKFYPIINFIQRFENAGYHSRFVGNMLHKVYSHFRKHQPTSPFPDTHFVQELIGFNLLTPKDALIQLQHERCIGQMRIQVMGIALQSESVPEKVLEQAAKIKAESLTQLASDATRQQALYNLICLGQIKENEMEEIRKHLKLTVAKMSTRNYFDLVLECKDQQIMKDLASAFQQLGPKLGINRVIRAVEKFQKFSVTSQMVYNILLEQLGANFHHIFNEQRIQILHIFAEGKLKQVDVFKKNLEKIGRNFQQYKQYYGDIIDDLFQLGLVEPDVVSLAKQSFERIQLTESQALKLLGYYVIADQPVEEIEKIAELVGQAKAKELYKTILLQEVIKRQYPESKANSIFDTLLKDEQFLQSREGSIGGGKARNTFPLEQVGQFLQVLGVNFKSHHKVNDVSIEIYLPEIDTAVFVLQGTQLNYDKVSLSGFALLQQKLLSLVVKNVITINFKEFNQISNPDDKAKFLINAGIPATVDPKTADYSTIPKSFDAKKQDKQ